MKKRIITVFIITAALLFNMNACSAENNNADTSLVVTEEQSYEENADIPNSNYNGDDLPDYFSQEQKSQLTELYNQAYEDETKGIDAYINDYIMLRTGQTEENYDPYGEVLENLIGTTESLYQAANEIDPGLKYELTALTEQKYGYIAGKGMQILLSDSEIGKTLRQAGEITAFAAIDIMLNWADDSAPKVTKYALMPCSVNGEYALMRTFGTLAEMVDEVTLPYTLAQSAIDERYDALEASVLQTATEDLNMQMNADPDNPEDVDAVYESMKISQPIYARLAVLDAKREVLKQDEKNVIDNFLTSKGITDYSLDKEAETIIPTYRLCRSVFIILWIATIIYIGVLQEKKI